MERTIAEFAATHPATADQLLPALRSVQQTHGYISSDAVRWIANALNISRAEVFGVVSFYDDFRTEPHGPEVEICAAEACQSLGCRSLLAETRELLGTDVVVREVFCLGNCAAGPSARIGDRIMGRASPAAIAAAVAAGTGS